MTEPGYRVVWPLGKATYQMVSLKPRISDLKGKTICELSHGGFRDEEVRPIIREMLSKRYPGIRFVGHTPFGNIHGSKEEEVVAALPGLLRKHGCDAVISGIGA
jgi:hypothetical protein